MSFFVQACAAAEEKSSADALPPAKPSPVIALQRHPDLRYVAPDPLRPVGGPDRAEQEPVGPGQALPDGLLHAQAGQQPGRDQVEARSRVRRRLGQAAAHARIVQVRIHATWKDILVRTYNAQIGSSSAWAPSWTSCTAVR